MSDTGASGALTGADAGLIALDCLESAVLTGGASRTSARVLLAECDPMLGEDLEHILIEAGFAIAGHARDGAEAVMLASKLRPDLVVLDVTVPGVHGLTAAGPISQQHIPVILLMAPSEAGLVHEAVAAGAMAWLVKPVVPPSLVATAHMVLARHAEAAELRRSAQQVRSRIEEHKLVERAKGLLMARHAVAESVAADWMRQTAEDTGSPIARVAAAIVDEWSSASPTRAASARRTRPARSDWLHLATPPKPPTDADDRLRPRRRTARQALHRG